MIYHFKNMTHKQKSLIKSWTRILGYITLFFNIPLAAVILVISEGLGIWEETNEK